MDSRLLRIAAISMAGTFILNTGLAPVSATMMATEQPIAGINLSLERYVETVVEQNETLDPSSVSAGGVVSSTDATPANEATTEAPEDTTAVAEENEAEDEHVPLNLNYDRLGIAKVDTYLNVRKKRSENSAVVGKLIKNAGCHIYNIKKGWAKIVSGKVTGYVKAKYLVTDKKAEEMALKVGKKVATVNVGALKVRALPSTDATNFSTVAIEEDFELAKIKLTKEWLDNYIANHVKKKELKKVNYDAVIADLDNWVCIKVDNDRAFVAKEYVDISYKLNRAVKVGELASDGSDGVSSGRASLVEYAKQFLGNRYVYGGTSLTNGTDCSGFSMGVYRHFGYSLPRTSGSQAASTRSIGSSQARPGDLFFYGNGSRVNHVAIYIGNGLVIHASNPSSGIKISNAYYRSPVKIGRVIND